MKIFEEEELPWMQRRVGVMGSIREAWEGGRERVVWSVPCGVGISWVVVVAIFVKGDGRTGSRRLSSQGIDTGFVFCNDPGGEREMG